MSFGLIVMRSLCTKSHKVGKISSEVRESQMPQDVHVTTRPRLVRWLKSLPIAIDETAVNEIYSKASLSTTWQ